MSALNTGLLLRRAHESPYAAFRRFLIANSDLSYGTAMRRLRQLMVDNDGNHVEQSTQARRAQRLETAYCQANGLAYQVPFGISETVRCTRNCQRCAEAGYHSDAYELPWLSRCPLHGEPLRTTCPRCRRPWPTTQELSLRHCVGCSAHLDIATLSVRQAFDAHWPFERLEALIGAMRIAADTQYHLVPDVPLRAVPSYDHAALSMRSEFFPSILCAMEAAYRDPLAALGVAIHPVHRYAGAVIELPDRSFEEPCVGRPSASLISRTRARVRTKIRRAVAVIKGAEHRLRSVTTGFNHRAQATCPYCIAFTIWLHHVYTADPFDLRPSTHFGAPLYECGAIRSMPVIPVPMQILTVIKDHHVTCYQLSEPLQEALYFLDLWTTFNNILHYVFYFYTSPYTAKTGFDFERQLPPQARPNNAISDAVGLYFTQENQLKIIVPKILLDNNLAPPKDYLQRPIRTPWEIYFGQKHACC